MGFFCGLLGGLLGFCFFVWIFVLDFSIYVLACLDAGLCLGLRLVFVFGLIVGLTCIFVVLERWVYLHIGCSS